MSLTLQIRVAGTNYTCVQTNGTECPYLKRQLWRCYCTLFYPPARVFRRLETQPRGFMGLWLLPPIPLRCPPCLAAEQQERERAARVQEAVDRAQSLSRVSEAKVKLEHLDEMLDELRRDPNRIHDFDFRARLRSLAWRR